MMDLPTPCQDSHPSPPSFSAFWVSRQGLVLQELAVSSQSELWALLWASCSLLPPCLFPEKSVKNAQVSGGLPHQIQDNVLDFKARGGVKHGGKEGDWILCWASAFE